MQIKIDFNHRLADEPRYAVDSNIPDEQAGIRSSVGYFLYSVDYCSVKTFSTAHIRTGVKLTIPQGYYGLITSDRETYEKKGLYVPTQIVQPENNEEIIVTVQNLRIDLERMFLPRKQDLIFGRIDQTIVNPGDVIANIIFQKFEVANFVASTTL